MSFTWRVNVVLSLPPALVADRVYVAEEDTAVGVPEIVPVDVSNVRPAGSVGDNAQNVGVPPLKVGVADVIAEPFVSVNGLALYASEDGAASLTRIVIDAVALPPVLLAVIVYVP